jgi:hypothetical protein
MDIQPLHIQHSSMAIESAFNRLLLLNFKDHSVDIRIIVPDGEQVIAAMQDGMAIISYMKYYKYLNRYLPGVLLLASRIGDYILNETLTNPSFTYGSFPRSSGLGFEFPIQQAAQSDIIFGPNTVSIYIFFNSLNFLSIRRDSCLLFELFQSSFLTSRLNQTREVLWALRSLSSFWRRTLRAISQRLSPLLERSLPHRLLGPRPRLPGPSVSTREVAPLSTGARMGIWRSTCACIACW